ncbi:hypothetical protein ABQX22_04290 [Xanthomonas sp. WHRI 1810A]|jgi:antitoxin component of MazEF toxin-antitoxin module|uniref:AbrB/MazE/SpoVT family DNA-binding domain-containing protein n=1 Tax=Xanthomonas sp. WHRI 1810A TaxID=3161565 RepID=UPI0032E9134A
MSGIQVTIEDWNGDGAIRIPDAVLQELGVDVGSTLFILDIDVEKHTLVLSSTPKVRDRVDELVDRLEDLNQKSALHYRT